MSTHQANITSTAAVCEALTLARLTHDDDGNDIRPAPSPTDLQGLTETVMEIVADSLADTSLADSLPSILYSLVYLWHRQATVSQRKADGHAAEVRDLLDQQDGSEVKDLELQRAQDAAHRLDRQASLFEQACERAAAHYEAVTGSPWLPPAGQSRRGYHSASIVDGKAFLKARDARKNAIVSTPDAPIVVFSGGSQYSDHARIWRVLDANRQARADMILATSGQTRGADAIAHAWARARDVEVVRCSLERKHGKRAAFLRNEQMLDLGNVIGAVVCRGSGVQEALIREARRRGLPVRRLDSET